MFFLSFLLHPPFSLSLKNNGKLSSGEDKTNKQKIPKAPRASAACEMCQVYFLGFHSEPAGFTQWPNGNTPQLTGLTLGAPCPLLPTWNDNTAL